MPLAHAPAARSGNENRHSFFKKQAVNQLRVLAALLEDRANVEPRIPMVRARARARGAVHR